MAELFDEKEVEEVEGWLRQREFISLRSMSDWIARKITKTFSWVTPNIVSIIGVALCLPTIWFLELHQIVLGFFAGTLAYVCDYLDGSLARYQTRRLHLVEVPLEIQKNWSFIKQISTKGMTAFGKSFDPFADKNRHFILLFYLGYDRVNHAMIYTGLVFAVALTAMRPIMSKWNLGSGASTRIGKIKVIIEVLGIIALFASRYWADQLWFPNEKALISIGNILVLLATLFGLGSLLGHVFLVYRKLKRTQPSA